MTNISKAHNGEIVTIKYPDNMVVEKIEVYYWSKTEKEYSLDSIFDVKKIDGRYYLDYSFLSLLEKHNFLGLETIFKHIKEVK